MSLVHEIESRLFDESISTAALLRMCIVLGGRSGSQALRAWASRELNGYVGEPVSVYRAVAASVYGVVLVGQQRVVAHPVSLAGLSELARRAGVREIVELHQGIGELEELAQTAEGSVRFSIPAASLLVAEINRYADVSRREVLTVYYSVTTAAIRGIVERVKAALAELIGEILIESPTEDEGRLKDIVDHAVTYIITGDRASVSISSVGSAGSVLAVQSAEGVDIGDKFSDIEGSTIVNRSMIANALTRLRDTPKRKYYETLAHVGALVEGSGSREAVEYFDCLSEELARSEPREAIARAMWEQILAIIPDAAEAAPIAIGIRNLLD